MEYRRLGRSDLTVSEISLGSWLTFGVGVDADAARACVEKAFDVKVTITDYDSNDTALTKVKAGGSGFDIVVPSANFVPVWISEGI